MNAIPQWQAITVSDGFLASTLTVPANRDAAPLVICCHGLTGTRIGSAYRYPRLAQRLARNGTACITFDFRGCGESSGNFDELNPASMREDLLAVIAWARSQPWCDEKHIGICASSFGAVTTASLAAQLRCLKAVALWAPVALPRQLVEQYMSDDAWALLRQQGWLPHRGLKLGQAFFDQVVAEDQNAATQLATATCPTLIFHGSGDNEVPYEHARAYEAALMASKSSFQLETLATDDHGMRDVAISDRLIEESAQWFQQHFGWE